jgi:hypothetical protein
MSGGYVRKQKAGEHQVVMFTFAGALQPEHVDAWNKAVLDLKKKFKGNLTGVTMGGHPTPSKLRTRGGK